MLSSSADFLALVPAALFPFSDCWFASAENASNSEDNSLTGIMANGGIGPMPENSCKFFCAYLK